MEVKDIAKCGTWLAEMSTVCAPANISAVGHTGKTRRQNGFDLDNLTYATYDSVVIFRPVDIQVGVLDQQYTALELGIPADALPPPTL